MVCLPRENVQKGAEKMSNPESAILDSQAEVEIILLDQKCAASRLACAELSEYLERCLGITAAVVLEKQSERSMASTAFYVGPLAVQQAAGPLHDAGPEIDLDPEGLFVRTREGAIVISGGSGTGVLYAAYAFIERFLGVRFMGLDSEEWVPTAESVEIPDTRIVEEPAIALRGGTPFGYASDDDFLKTIDWMAKNRLNYLAFCDVALAPMMKRMIEELEVRGIRVSLGGHALDLFLYDTWRLATPEGNDVDRGEACERIAQAKLLEHPEWHCLKGGKRVLCGRSLGHFCFSCDEAVDEFCRNVVTFVEENPFLHSLSLCLNDARPVFCGCDKCRRQPLADIIQGFYNSVADRVHRVRPDLEIVATTYADWCIPPSENALLRKKVSIEIAPWKQDYRHGIGATPSKHQRYLRLVKKWLKFMHQCEGDNAIALFQYYSYIMCSLGPRLTAMFEDARLCTQLGIPAIHDNLLLYALRNGFPKVLTAYFLARALWNPAAEPNQVVEELFDPVFGTASEDMKAVLRISDQLGATCLAPVWWRWYQYPLDYIHDCIPVMAETLGELQRAEDLLKTARQRCDTPFGAALIEKSDKWLPEVRTKVGNDKIFLEALEMIISRLDGGGDIAERGFVESVCNKLMTTKCSPEERERIRNLPDDVTERVSRVTGLPGDIARWVHDFDNVDAALANVAAMTGLYDWQGCSFAKKEQGCDDCCIIACPDYLEGPGRQRYPVRQKNVVVKGKDGCAA